MKSSKDHAKDKRILVTGGRGFLGSHLVDALKDLNEVLVYDNLSNPAISKERENIIYFDEDVLDSRTLINSSRNVDLISHYAAYPSVEESSEDPVYDFRQNVRGTLNVLEAARRNDVPRVLFASSCYDKKTRAFVAGGKFKPFNELRLGDKVLSINPKTKSIEEKPVIHKFVRSYKGPMIHFKVRRVDLLVTPNHRMLIETPSKRELRFEDASSTSRRSAYLLPKGFWKGRKKGKSTVPEPWSLKDFCHLMGLFIGDGYICDSETRVRKTGLNREDWLKDARDEKGRSTSLPENPKEVEGEIARIFFAIPPEDKARPSLERLLNKYDIDRHSSDTQVYFTSWDLLPYFNYCGNGAKDKRIPRWILKLPEEGLSSVLRGLIESDGHGRNIKISSSTLAHNIVELCSKLGMGTSLGTRKEVGEIEERTVESLSYEISIAKTQAYLTKNNSHKETYEGKIWCPTVKDNGNLLLERNGKMAFCGNSTVYGDAEEIPTPESAPLNAICIHGASKASSEMYVKSYSSTYGIRATILRYANIFGPRQTHRVMRDFYHKLKEDPRRLEILGDGSQRKSYLYIDDCVNATLKALEADGKVEIFNIGSEEQITVAKIAEIISDELGLDPKFEYTGGRRGWRGDVPEMLLDIGKIKELGWKPEVPIIEGIRRYIKWLEEREG